MGLKFCNFGKAIVTSAPTGTTGLSFTVEPGKGLLFPPLGASDFFYGIFKDASGNREIVKVEARSTDAMTIAAGGRGIDGTTARTWAAGDYFVAGITNIALETSIINENLQAIGALTTSADKLPYFTGSAAATLTAFTAFARTILDDTDSGAMLSTLGVSEFIKTLLNDTSSSAARATLGAFSQIGTTTSDNADAGDVGEIISASVLSGAAVSLVNIIPKTVTSITLTPGDWEIWGNVKVAGIPTTTLTQVQGSSSATANTLDDASGFSQISAAHTPGGNFVIGGPIPVRRATLAASKTFYLIAYCAFSAGTAKAYGSISARRMR